MCIILGVHYLWRFVINVGQLQFVIDIMKYILISLDIFDLLFNIYLDVSYERHMVPYVLVKIGSVNSVAPVRYQPLPKPLVTCCRCFLLVIPSPASSWLTIIDLSHLRSNILICPSGANCVIRGNTQRSDWLWINVGEDIAQNIFIINWCVDVV